jgi:type I restriction enzyme, S subunit
VTNNYLLKEICNLRKEKFDPKRQGNKTYIGLEHIAQETGRLINTGNSKDTTSIKNVFYEGDILFGKLRPYLKKFWFATFDGVCGTEILPIYSKEKIENKYLFYLFQQDKFINFLTDKSFGTKMPRTSWKDISEYEVYVPNQLAQRKIADILTSIDSAIEKTETIIEQTEKVKKGLMQQLLTKGIGHTEFKKTEIGEIPKKWEIVKVKDILEEYKVTSSDLDKYPLYSLTIEEGLTEKTERYERSFLLKDKENNKYRLVKPSNILFNPMNLRFGAIAVSNEEKIVSVSAYYNVLELKNPDFSPYYYYYLFKSHLYMGLYESISTGSLIEKKRVHLSQFIKLSVPVPPKDEQYEIVKIIKSVDDKVRCEQSRLEKFKTIKQGLMQVLLTGKVLVKVDEEEVITS